MLLKNKELKVALPIMLLKISHIEPFSHYVAENKSVWLKRSMKNGSGAEEMGDDCRWHSRLQRISARFRRQLGEL
jgi:hypothetical protein